MFNALNLKNHSFIILLGILSLTGACLLLLSTSPWGVSLGSDSIYYLAMARLFENYAVNKGMLSVFLSNLQPLFPFVLSWWHFIGIDPLEGARWSDSILFGLNILLIGTVTKKYTKSAWMGLSAALLFLSAPDIVVVHLEITNEPLFIFFMLTWLLLFLGYLKNPKLSVLILSSIVVALASMTRFAGIPIIVTGLLAILFLSQEKIFIHKMGHALVFVSVPCLSLFLWSRYGYIENGPYQRHFAFHPVHLSYFRDMISFLCSWFLPPNVDISVNEKIFLFTAGIIFCCIRLFLWRPTKTISTKFSILGITFIGTYTGCLILAASFYDADMYHGIDRYFIPIHIMGLIIFCRLMSNFFQEHSSSFKKDIGRIMIIYLFLFYIAGSVKCLMHQYNAGDAAISNPNRFSYVIRKIKTLPVGTPVYSNDFQAVYLWGGRISSAIPFYQSPFSLIKNGSYESQISQMAEDLRSRKGVLVYFDQAQIKFIEPIEELQKKMPLHLIARDEYASIFDVQ